MKLINITNIQKSFIKYHQNSPYDHCIVDNFLTEETIQKIEQEFLDYSSGKWFIYQNLLENKKACNDWNIFGPATYSLFSYLNSQEFVEILSGLTNIKLIPDPGLHGGGWHCHGVGGNLNPHLDYSIHPKTGLQRVINIILYVSKELRPLHGGYLGLWEHNKLEDMPGKLMAQIEPRFNRAVIFNTTQNSWHGMSEPLTVPDGIYRKSLAVYYLQEIQKDVLHNKRAKFAARENQNHEELKALIKLRSGIETSHLVYRGKK